MTRPNLKYDYSQIKVDYPHQQQLKWGNIIRPICPIHGEFKISYGNRIRGQGCAKCVCKNVTTEEFIQKVGKKHDYKYNYSKFVYVNNTTKGIIICPIHGEFEQTPASHLAANGCKQCSITHKNRGKYTFEYCFIMAKLYEKISDWQNNDVASYGAAHRNGWIDQCTKHMKKYYRLISTYTLKECQKEAKKYESKNEWNRNHRGTYRAAWKNGWIDQCTKHMKKILPRGYWQNIGNCVKDARKYGSKKEWANNSPSAYTIATRNKWIDQCCKHMK